MRFVIDESSWYFDVDAPEKSIEELENLLNQIDKAQKDGHIVYYSEELFVKDVCNGNSFYDLYSKDSQIIVSREVREQVASVFSRLGTWQDVSDGFRYAESLTINGIEVSASSIAWAHSETVKDHRNCVACLVFPVYNRVGLCNVLLRDQEVPLWLICCDQEYLEYFRWLISETTTSVDDMEKLAKFAFPSVDFVENAFNGIKKMSKPYGELVRDIVLHLGVMSDHGVSCFSGLWQDAPGCFSGHGVTVSDENGKTKQNRNAESERTVKFNDSDIVCWWHSKLEPDRDRIYFSPDEVKNGGHLIVGIFCRHLTV